MDKNKQIEEMALIIHKIMPIGLELSAAVATDLYSADYLKRSEGEWKTEDTMLGKCCTCSVCGGCPTMEYRYCPYCGAKMKGGKTDA